MKIAVVGLWHLGCVTAACLSKLGHSVIAYDENVGLISRLNQGETPVYEPELSANFSCSQEENRLFFSCELNDIEQAEIIWITYDTPVNEEGYGDSDAIKQKIIQLFPYFKPLSLVIISSQLPVGTTREIESIFNKKYKKQVDFIYSPENLRLGNAIKLFLNPDRIIMGISTDRVKVILENLFLILSDKLIWMSVEAAEMTKHAINSFLATSIVFINELALLCEQQGIDVKELEKGLKTDVRIGKLAYLSAGAAFSGGTLLRDINYLLKIGEDHQLAMDLFKAVLLSNQKHFNWTQKKLSEKLKQLAGKKIAILGLAYKAGTNSLRHSLMVKISKWLHEQGATISAYDPIIKTLSSDLTETISLENDMTATLYQADAVVIGTSWTQAIQGETLLAALRQPYVFDAAGFLENQLRADKRINYYSVGVSNA